MSRIPVEPGYFRIPDDPSEVPRLLGSYSPEARTSFFPRRKLCPITSTPVEDRELSPTGVLYSWTFIKMPRMGVLEEAADGGHGVGQIDLPEGVRIQARIAGRMGDWRIGMPMRLAVLPLAKDEKGNELCSFQFVPVEEVSA